MGARRKGRAAFDFGGRAFVWWIENDKYLRIASADKTFIIAYAIGRDPGDVPTIEVIGQSFPGIESRERPLWLVVREPVGSMGEWVHQLLTQAFESGRQWKHADAALHL